MNNERSSREMSPLTLRPSPQPSPPSTRERVNMRVAEKVRLHHPRHHAAVRTQDYVFSQLIPYIGNKRKLLHLIAQAVDFTGVSAGTFVDLFTGSTVVGR